jgi:exopolyphosphatase/guanosine-5'-triphosphate,3'-diphosphate pyrophosphatase
MHAAIDIGTNSIHLVVARPGPGGGFDVVTTEKEMVRLGSGGGDMKLLQPGAVDRGVAALARMVDVARSFGAEISAVATSAVREAENRNEFLDRVRRETGIEVEVISGFEEARLIHHGVIHALPVSDQRVLVVDIGGGSTELIIGEGAELIEARSLRLGAIRLSQRFFAPAPAPGSPATADEQPPPPDAVATCRRYLEGELSVVARELGGHRPQLAIGSSGTITAVATMIAAAEGAELRQVNGYAFTAEQLAKAVSEVVSLPASARHKLRELDERRADIIVGGILLLEEIFAAFELESMTISEYALREGVLFDRFSTGIEHLHNLRRSNALRLARQLDPDAAHSEHTARLAVQLFDRTEHLHGLGPDSRELLDTAAVVHNVGLFISHSGHHKHSYYIIRNSEQLTGFSDHETELIALVARYHRKSLPSDKHAELAGLSKADKRLVRTLAGMLRIAIGLDRRHSRQVTSVAVRAEPAAGNEPDGAGGAKGAGDRLVIEPVVPSGADVSLEVFSAGERARLLAQALRIPIVVRDRQAG